jgi:hypothetical protein
VSKAHSPPRPQPPQSQTEWSLFCPVPISSLNSVSGKEPKSKLLGRRLLPL